MALERTTQTQTTHRESTNPDDEGPWSDLELTVPNDRDRVSIVALVECALVELTHEDVGAVLVEQQVGRTKRTQYVTIDDVGKRFRKRYFDDRLGWHETTVPRQTTRDELVAWLTRSPSSVAGSSGDSETIKPDIFTVKPTHVL
ncbi:hypothetical protein ACFQH2_18750 [Natronoarchaeum sp. GCM10025703]|uniref:hypothetical protein n=1 Tax=unclassified Natronoarchaeum TaxID=2620183 RepID=UPI00361A3041